MYLITILIAGAVMVVIIWLLDLQLPVQSVLITTDVNSNPAHVKVYSTQYFCDKVCQWLVTGRWFSVRIPPPIELFKLSAIQKCVCGRNILLCGRGRVQGGIWNNVKFQNEQKTYFILARVRIIWMYETRWVTFGCQPTGDGNNHSMKWPKSLL
jgi:hypothetical protein